MSEKITIRRFESQDLAAVQEMMCGGICEADCRCCACNGTGKTKADISPDFLLQHAQQSHFYVAESSGRIIGAAAIARWQSRNNESIIAFLYRHRDVPAEESTRFC